MLGPWFISLVIPHWIQETSTFLINPSFFLFFTRWVGIELKIVPTGDVLPFSKPNIWCHLLFTSIQMMRLLFWHGYTRICPPDLICSLAKSGHRPTCSPAYCLIVQCGPPGASKHEVEIIFAVSMLQRRIWKFLDSNTVNIDQYRMIPYIFKPTIRAARSNPPAIIW